MNYEIAGQIEVNQVETVAGEDELEAESLGEFLQAALVSLIVIAVVSGALYLGGVAIVALGTSGIQ